MPPTSVVRRGQTGADVVWLQQALTTHGFHVKADGAFGGQTEALLMQFQRSRGLSDDGIAGRLTVQALAAPPTRVPVAPPPSPVPPILQQLQKLGFKNVWKADHHLQFTALRNTAARPNYFDDVLIAHWTERGLWKSAQWPITTTPGFYWRQNPMNVAGVGCIAEGQYEAWQIGVHGGANGYEGLVQTFGPLDSYRDNDRNRDLTLDPKTIQRGVYVGANVHRATRNGTSTEVDRWSAMCLVHARSDGFDEMMGLARLQVERTAIKGFNLTLVRQDPDGRLWIPAPQ